MRTKIKYFTFYAQDINPYMRQSECNACASEAYGSSNQYTEIVDNTINDFCKGKDVIDIRQSSHCQGNNPPRYFIDVMVIYKELNI